MVGFRLYLITDRHAVKSGDLVAACEAAVTAAAPGTVALQLREKDLPARELYELALRLRQICTRAGAPLIGPEDIAARARRMRAASLSEPVTAMGRGDKFGQTDGFPGQFGHSAAASRACS